MPTIEAPRATGSEPTPERLSERQLIVVSNRGPVDFHWDEREGRLRAKKAPGGVATAVSSVGKFTEPPVWIAAAMSKEDHMRAAQTGGELSQVSFGDYRFQHRLLAIPEKVYYPYYKDFSNSFLWFLQHQMLEEQTPEELDRIWQAWDNGYVKVNALFADSVLSSLTSLNKPPLIMLQDYHLYLVPRFLRQQTSGDIFITHFTHIPWPTPEYWGQHLRDDIRSELLRGLTAADVAGFQTNSYRENFLKTCDAFLDGASINPIDKTVKIDGHVCHTAVYPISIDVGELKKRAGEVKNLRREIEAHTSQKTIVRVDRMDPTKNILRGFQAFDVLLERYPEYRGKIKFLAFLVPTRSGINRYEEYSDAIKVTVDEINSKYRTPDWTPITVFKGDNYPRAVAAMQLYDVLLVNPILDGMNLVSKEGPIVNQRNGVLVLSKEAGSWEQLAVGTVPIDPFNISDTVTALHAALEMPQDERRRRNDALRQAIEGNDISRWFQEQLNDVRQVLGEKNS